MRLTHENHDRDLAGLTYIYPVVSRRAQGVSVGINLNPNNACNFRCAYCQVPELVLGKAPEIDVERLIRELESLLDWVLEGDFMEKVVPEGSRRLNDLAFSGNGEPTSAAEFDIIVQRVGEVMQRRGLLHKIKLVLITNGSLIHQAHVQRGLAHFNELGGEVWFKLDSATEAGQARINDFHAGLARVTENLTLCAGLAPTWIQSCALAMDGEAPSRDERDALLGFLKARLAEGIQLQGVLLYGLARQSHQPEAPRLSALDEAWMESWGAELRALGLEVRVSL
mgnify:CR=1 FL=1